MRSSASIFTSTSGPTSRNATIEPGVNVEANDSAKNESTFEQIDSVKRLVGAHPDVFELAYTADDIERVHRRGRIASLIGMEGGAGISDSLGVLREFRRADQVACARAPRHRDDREIGGLQQRLQPLGARRGAARRARGSCRSSGPSPAPRGWS